MALARRKDAVLGFELFQQFAARGEKPLKRLDDSSPAHHGAKAPVLMGDQAVSTQGQQAKQPASAQQQEADDHAIH